ncbi:hypothetical protein [Natranaerobius thermophilus]|uniref:Uncharacterized protein n=1 Tax=Natranaerobius thermophilus (strain ATCC BAA-1301 / DSM 18059 / JW/NM-WN-LF) TaxID=457570 RepID=B2A1S7_NATTJ|nr:hypothetical protein [Natranaerobius thermophilus]ACB86124.1 hypothetical protein Nther_2566 [Natranaerobius thermophilus JW/NM-WN-LF]
MNQLVLDYIISLTNLYGLVHKDKVIEIYNMQNNDQINTEIIDSIMEPPLKSLIITALLKYTKNISSPSLL